MAYQVMARKWRPSTFDEIVGQQHVTQTLANAVRLGKIGHAFLFSGPRGVGKTTTARILAKALNCINGPTPEPCQTCPACVAIKEGRSMDVLEIDGASNNGVDEVRSLKESVGYTPQQGNYRVYIIDEVHMLSQSAFNALLKTLEEPPAHVVFMFATTEPQKIPATVLSRCQRFDFRKIPVSRIVEHLSSIIAAEEFDVAEDALHFIARKADGAMRDAQSLLEQLLSFTEGRVTIEAVADVLGVVESDRYFKLMEFVHNGDAGGALRLLNETVDHGRSLDEFLSGLMEYLRDLMVSSVPGGDVQIEVSADELERYKNQAALFSSSDLLRMLNLVAGSEFALNRSSQPRVIAELTLMKLVHMPSSVDLERLLARLDSGSTAPATSTPAPLGTSATEQSKPSQGDAGTSLKSPDVPSEYKAEAPHSEGQREQKEKKSLEAPVSVERQTATLETIKARWAEFTDFIGQHKKSLAGTLGNGTPCSFDSGVLVVELPGLGRFHTTVLEKEKKMLLNLANQMFDGIKDITLVQSGDLHGKEDQTSRENPQRAVPEKKPSLNALEDMAIHREPIIGSLKEALNMKIVQG